MSEGKQLLERLLSTGTKGELLQLFHGNPGLVDSPEGVARRIGRSAPEIEEAVKDFEEMGILSRGKVGTIDVLKYNRARDRDVQGSIEAYFRSLSK